MTIASQTAIPPCANEPELFEEVDPLASTPQPIDGMTERMAIAHRSCAGCPLLIDCLYHAVVEVDVSGFVACTTEADRADLRRRLGIEVVQSGLAPYGNIRPGGGPVSHEAVVAMRQSHPTDTCQQLADRLGCSTSTVKRHLRRAREESAQASSTQESLNRRVPTVDEVLDAFDDLATSRFT